MKYPGSNICSLWIAGEDSRNAYIYIEDPDAKSITVYYWGMCTDYGYGTRNLSVTDDNNSIGDASQMWRGDWGSPNRMATTLNVDKFKEGLTPSIVNVNGKQYKEYRRDVNIFRCYLGSWNYDGACSSMVEPVILRILDNRSLTVKYVGTEKACYGKTEKSYTMRTDVFQDDDKDNQISVDTLISEYVGEGWVFAGIDGASNNGDNITVDVSSGSKTVTIYLEKHPLCLQCDAWTPIEYSGSTAEEARTVVLIGVMNNSVDNDNSKWHHQNKPENELEQGVIYAKPTDDVQWHYCYFPGVERAALADVTVNNEHHPHTADAPLITNLNNKAFHEAYDGWKGTFRTWSENLKPEEENVEYTGETKATGDDMPTEGTLPGGELTENDKNSKEENGFQADASRIYKIQQRVQPSIHLSPSSINLDPGTTLVGNIETLTGNTYVKREEQDHQWSCQPYYDSEGIRHYHTCAHDKKYILNDRSAEQKSDSAMVRVPYNFKNTARAAIKDNQDVLFAGEEVVIESPKVTIGRRGNEVTQGDYATQVRADEGKVKLIAFLVDSDGQIQWNTNDRSDHYQNSINPDDNGRIWNSPSDNPCGALNAKFGVCEYLEDYTGMLNSKGNMDGIDFHMNRIGSSQSPETVIDDPTADMETKNYDVFDEAAGNYFCVAAAVYPFSVQSDTDVDVGSDGAWYISEPSCKQIAKRPTFQVWGAGVFVAGNVDTSTVTVKSNLLGNANQGRIRQGQVRAADNYQAWVATGGSNNYFGSWAELTATIQGTADTFASGASLGYRGGLPSIGSFDTASNANPIGVGYPGGSTSNNDNCKRNPLTIANNSASINCASEVGRASVESLRQSISSDISALTQRFENIATTDQIQSEQLNDIGTPGNPDATIVIPKGQTRVNIASGTLTIHSNITYDDDNPGFKNLEDIPKYIIYTKGDIHIDCGVRRIDAVIIADGGEVNTCGTGHLSSPAEASNNSTQLVINGAVVAGSITLNRTFGANTGGNSIVPAELINYDSTLYLWANRVASAGESGILTETASRELAPRY